LDKATSIGYTEVNNGLWTASFTLPADDLKNVYCQPFNYVEIYDNKKRIELFRILPSTLSRSTNGYITYQCEHVIATLIDNVLFKYHEIGNVGVYTPQVIRYVLDRQKTKNWQLGKCHFNKQFLYKWENENLCSALFSIPNPFIEEYHWTYDTTSYPWTVNLVAAEKVAGCEIRYKKNMQSIEKAVDPTNVITRIYPLGYGEGDNQLTIESVNSGIPYLEADTTTTYGLKEVIWVDRRYEDAESLKETARSMMNELKVPYVSYSVSSLDLFKKTLDSFDEYKEGKIVRVIDTEDDIDIDAKIVQIEKTDVTKAAINIIIANKSKDVAGSIADLQERARINETYAQGSATLLTIPYNDNADTSYPAIFEFYLPSSMVNINKASLKVQIQQFRGYSKAIKGGGAIATSTQSGGGSSQTSSSGGGTSTSTSSGGGSQQTSSSGGSSTATSSSGGATTSGASSSSTTSTANESVSITRVSYFSNPTYNLSTTIVDGHSHGVEDHGHIVNVSGHSHNMAHTHTISSHTHSVSIPAHTHSVSIPAHTHSVTISEHTHTVSIPAHTHNITIPEHTHDIQFGIYLGTSASSIQIKVDGNTMPTLTNLNSIDIIKYLSTDSSGKIQRDTWHKIEIYPDKLTRISAYLFLDIFTNSRGGGDY